MSCYICGRSSCIPSFHSIEEQEYFDRAEQAYDVYLSVLEECREEYANRDMEDDDL